MQKIFAGEVCEGEKLGRKLRFPTANLLLSGEDLSLLKDFYGYGVFAVKVDVNGVFYQGVMHFGPKGDGIGSLSPDIFCEIHLLYFDQEIYGEKITFSVLFKVREVRKFGSLSDLSSQIARDVEFVKSLL